MPNVCNKYVLIVLFAKISAVSLNDKPINCSWPLLHTHLALLSASRDLASACLASSFAFWCSISDRALNRFEEYLYSFGLYKQHASFLVRTFFPCK